MIEVNSSLVMACEQEKAFAYIADFENNPQWQLGMVAARWTTPPPRAIGSTYEQEARFMGRRILSTFRVTEWDPPRRVSIESIGGTFPIQVTRAVEPHADGCRVSAYVRGQPGCLFWFAGPLLRRMVRNSVRGDYERLKARLESAG
jgi:hypothetical protein